MKLFAASVLFLIFTGLVIVTSAISGKLELESFPPSALMVTNLSDKSIPVYLDKAEANQIVMHLQPGISIPYAYSGNTGEWHYVFIDEGIVVTLRSKNIGYSYKISETTNVSTGTVNATYWVSLIGSIASFLALLIMLVFKVGTRRDEEIDDFDGKYSFDLEVHKPAVNKKETANIKPPVVEKTKEHQADDQQKEHKAALQKKAEKEAQLKKAQLAKKVKQEKERKQQELIAAKKARAETRKSEVELTENQKKEIARLRHELILIVDEESRRRYRGEATIGEMKKSYDRLFEKYKSIKSEAETLGIEFTDQKYKNLLKTRGYHNFVVSSLIGDNKFTVIEWIPDKGYDSDTVIESTTGPNFIVQDNQGSVIGLVCKYRSSEDEEGGMCWASDKQAEQYKKFSRSRNMPLYIAIGLKGIFKAPKYNFLVPLDVISEHSQRVHDADAGFQLVVRSKDLEQSLVKRIDYSGCLASKV